MLEDAAASHLGRLVASLVHEVPCFGSETSLLVIEMDRAIRRPARSAAHHGVSGRSGPGEEVNDYGIWLLRDEEANRVLYSE